MLRLLWTTMFEGWNQSLQNGLAWIVLSLVTRKQRFQIDDDH